MYITTYSEKGLLLSFETLCENLKKYEAVDGSVPLTEIIAYINRSGFEVKMGITDNEDVSTNTTLILLTRI